MRSEKIKRYLIMAMVGALVLLAPLSYLRVLWAAKDLQVVDLNAAFTGSHVITDRDGTALYDGGCLAGEVVGNLVGEEGLIDNALYHRYAELLAVGGFDPLVGRESLQGATLETTLMPIAYQWKIREQFGGNDGACFAYNYQTGEVYIALSLPCGVGENLREGSMFNGCLSGTYVPASTMKILTAICALSQNRELGMFEFTCEGSYLLPDGKTVNCHGCHGKLDLSDALGLSCNCYMAALIRQLDEKETGEILARLGVLNEGQAPVEDGIRGNMGRLSYVNGRTGFDSFDEFQSVWGLIGQGDTRVNPVYMAAVAGAVASGGTAAQPWIVSSVTQGDTRAVEGPGERMKLMGADAARLVKLAWSLAVEEYYHTEEKPLSEHITLAKTGTAESDKSANDRLLLGVMEEYNTAFFIIVEDSVGNSGRVFRVANMLAEAVAAM